MIFIILLTRVEPKINFKFSGNYKIRSSSQSQSLHLLRQQQQYLFFEQLMQAGQDQKGSFYPNIDQMWEVQLNNKQAQFKVVDKVGSKDQWYNKANLYWQKTQSTYDGVLGGYGGLSSKDTNYSLKFILKLVQQRPSFQRISAIDCGAGIGRISKQLLCQVFKTVDVIDQCEKYVQKSKEILKQKNIRHFYCFGLQDFKFQEKYDCIWIQWVLSHLSDKDAVDFFKRAKTSLNEGGVIILKQNHCKVGFLVDKEDYSVTRSTQLYKKIVKQAGLEIIKQETQIDWPKDLFTVRIYALA